MFRLNSRIGAANPADPNNNPATMDTINEENNESIHIIFLFCLNNINFYSWLIFDDLKGGMLFIRVLNF